ncbi:hypothetical protein ACJX0J_024975, partial [Zea mays]
GEDSYRDIIRIGMYLRSFVLVPRRILDEAFLLMPRNIYYLSIVCLLLYFIHFTNTPSFKNELVGDNYSRTEVVQLYSAISLEKFGSSFFNNKNKNGLILAIILAIVQR